MQHRQLTSGTLALVVYANKIIDIWVHFAQGSQGKCSTFAFSRGFEKKRNFVNALDELLLGNSDIGFFYLLPSLLYFESKFSKA
jgi:hypothetical protein